MSTLTIDKILEAERNLNNRLDQLALKPPPIRIIFNDHLTEQVQTKYPKKKNSRRWTKKYRKKYTQTVPSDKIYTSGTWNCFICHPVMKPEIDRFLAENELMPISYCGGAIK
jgi:hypothetical protein